MALLGRVFRSGSTVKRLRSQEIGRAPNGAGRCIRSRGSEKDRHSDRCPLRCVRKGFDWEAALPFQTPITIAKALERIHTHEYVLPAIQREFVWDTDQVCALFDSLMRGYPIGSFLVWKVEGRNSDRFVFYDFIRNYHQLTAPHCPQLAVTPGQPVVAILDGQQRLTALNIALRGSHAEKLPWRRIKDPNAYPVRHLYLDLRHQGANDDLSLEYKFEFLFEAEAQVASDGGEDPPRWFRVRDILDMKPGPGMFAWLLNAGLNDSELAFELLDRLHEVTSRDALISYYEEESQDLDRVLNIFIRVNSGGTVLSYSDLLLSIATAQWKERDAREAIHGLVDELNATGQGFAFSKDLILKAGLVLMNQGISASRSITSTRTRCSRWSRVGRRLPNHSALQSDYSPTSASPAELSQLQAS